MAVDCHIHMALDGGYWKDALARHKEAPDEQFIRKTLETYKSLGFTYLRDGGDRWNAGKRASELAPEYGIRYRGEDQRRAFYQNHDLRPDGF